MHLAVQLWCTKETEDIEMIPDLAENSGVT